ncbi:MAG TPA: sigma-70 family RNA polymerase sigma factor [Beutenbergiaceae bacterium]|nr:sigma-70 family RNA polymerase sigma factor [Beutenbergiaceae bacterium]
MTDLAMEQYRGELIGYCYRFFGCYSEAEDAVQETFARAWQHEGEFENRSSLRRWLYAIATNACLDMKKARQRRSLPMDLTSPGEVPADPGSLRVLPEANLIGPISDGRLSDDPAELAAVRDSVRLAFIAALQALPPRQRVVLILRDVLAWSARECADLLETTTASVNSALLRARGTMRTYEPHQGDTYDEQLLMNYTAAFEAYDVDRLVALLAKDAQFSMPPFELWFQGREEIEKWWRGPGEVCRGARTIPARANGQPAAAVYHPDGQGQWAPFAIHVLDVAGSRIAGITHFMGAVVFGEFGLPDHLRADEPVGEIVTRAMSSGLERRLIE